MQKVVKRFYSFLLFKKANPEVSADKCLEKHSKHEICISLLLAISVDLLQRKCWHGLPGEAVDAPSRAALQTTLAGTFW